MNSFFFSFFKTSPLALGNCDKHFPKLVFNCKKNSQDNDCRSGIMICSIKAWVSRQSAICHISHSQQMDFYFNSFLLHIGVFYLLKQMQWIVNSQLLTKLTVLCRVCVCVCQRQVLCSLWNSFSMFPDKRVIRTLEVLSRSLFPTTIKFTLWPSASGCTSQCGFTSPRAMVLKPCACVCDLVRSRDCRAEPTRVFTLGTLMSYFTVSKLTPFTFTQLMMEAKAHPVSTAHIYHSLGQCFVQMMHKRSVFYMSAPLSTFDPATVTHLLQGFPSILAVAQHWGPFSDSASTTSPHLLSLFFPPTLTSLQTDWRKAEEEGDLHLIHNLTVKWPLTNTHPNVNKRFSSMRSQYFVFKPIREQLWMHDVTEVWQKNIRLRHFLWNSLLC